jgi:uncharacterized protein
MSSTPGEEASAPRRPRRHRLLIVLVVVVLTLVAVFHLGGGWYFSGLIHHDGLRVDNKPPGMTLRVERVRNGPPRCVQAPGVPEVASRTALGCVTVTLSELDEDQPALDEPTVYGLEWESGYGQLHGEVELVGGDAVRRQVLVLDGSPPRRGDEARLDRSAFPADPETAVGRPVREVRYSSPAGEFPAWYAPGRGDTWVILVHGYRSSRTEVLRAMSVTTGMRMPTLAISYRNDGGVARDESGRYRFGETEWHELDAAVQYALDRGAGDVSLVANSMGGAITASFLGRSPLSDRVTAVVLDSPMLDFGETVSHGASQKSLPLLGSVPGSLVGAAKLLATARYGVDWGAIDYLEDTSWVTAPTLVLHGTADLRVPIATSQRLAAAEPELVRLRSFPDAEHVGAWNQDPRTYTTLVRDFLRAP